MWGYRILDKNDNELDSCWGFYGSEYVREEAMLSAMREYDAIVKKHEAKKRAEIVNHVPLSKRSSLSNCLMV